MNHPEELLAAYVDGALGDQERGEVEAHLRSCARCQEELELAGRAHAVLADLPDLDVPPGTVQVRPVRVLRPRRARRVRWAAGLAAAASIAAILTLVVVGGNKPGGGVVGGALTAPGAVSTNKERTIKQPETDYDPARIAALADTVASRIAHQRDQAKHSGPLTTSGSGTASAVPAPSAARSAFSALAGGSPVACLRGGAGLPLSKAATRVIEARYQGKPAYIGAFFQGRHPSMVVVWVVSRDHCTPLASVTRQLP